MSKIHDIEGSFIQTDISEFEKSRFDVKITRDKYYINFMATRNGSQWMGLTLSNADQVRQVVEAGQKWLEENVNEDFAR
jgi:hypothetical protein